MKKAFLFSILLVLLIGAGAGADGFIIPVRPPDVVRVPPLSIRYHRVEVDITDQVARTRIDQVFLNEFHRDLEGTYIFPIPEEASISQFSMWVDGERLDGRLHGKDEARRIYEDIIRREQDPALLEYLGRDLFKARVYPIPAHGEKRISLDYSEVLKMDSGLCQYQYSLNTEKFSAKPIQEVSLTINLDSSRPIKTVYSPTHDITVDKRDDYHAAITYVEEGTKPDKDFILYYTVSKTDFGLNLLTYREKGDDGFFLAMIAPKIHLDRDNIISKQILFVLDTSGSMSGEKIEQAKDALTFCLDNLNEGDLFNIISFNTEIETFMSEPVRVTRSRIREARDFVERLDADGGTNINDALLTALEQIESNEHLNVIVFLTDGLPTVGITENAQILNNVSGANDSRSRLFIFGVGYDVNTHLLDKMSEQNDGVSEYVRPEESIEVKVSSFYGKIANPILTDLVLDFGRIDVAELYPRHLPDLFKGSQLLVLGRYTNTGSSTIRLSGKTGHKNREYRYESTFPPTAEKNDFIPRLWASRKIGYLIDEIRLHGQNKELIDEVVRLSKKYGIMTEYTSFLVDVDVHVAMEELEDRATENFSRASREEKGAWAVGQAQNALNMKKMAMAPTNEFYDASGEVQRITSVKQITNKTFYFQNNVWVDNEYALDQKLIKVKRFSEAYFQLSRILPKMNQYLAVGNDVIVNIGTQSFQIGEDGKTRFTQEELRAFF
jgi:Ca-activated chloride channel family protein